MGGGVNFGTVVQSRGQSGHTDHVTTGRKSPSASTRTGTRTGTLSVKMLELNASNAPTN